MIPGQIELCANFLLEFMLLRAIGADILLRFECGKLRRRTVLVGRAYQKRVSRERPVESREDIGGKHRAYQIAQMLDPVDVGKRARDQNTCHGLADLSKT